MILPSRPSMVWKTMNGSVTSSSAIISALDVRTALHLAQMLQQPLAPMQWRLAAVDRDFDLDAFRGSDRKIDHSARLGLGSRRRRNGACRAYPLHEVFVATVEIIEIDIGIIDAGHSAAFAVLPQRPDRIGAIRPADTAFVAGILRQPEIGVLGEEWIVAVAQNFLEQMAAIDGEICRFLP